MMLLPSLSIMHYEAVGVEATIVLATSHAKWNRGLQFCNFEHTTNLIVYDA